MTPTDSTSSSPALRRLEHARARFDLLARRGEDTTNAAYELSQALAAVELARATSRTP
ncbi:hypothetical protein [Actinocatenispora rupis]|uniref:Uncharacterized protein n=1 Tax=Actinocatenispora rupis TaxID=519421 RepID=A0A8J3J5Z7_9ACTN|nr:hypothetical protein [Actinocatenispora rupis]GID12226.1 hypothetical protein Aru02nite_31150 [Actinocatenispora rupis]